VRVKRRKFLKNSVAGTAGLWLAGALSGANTSAAEGRPSDAPGETHPAFTSGADPTAVVPLGRALTACRLGAGTGMAGGNRQSNMTRMGKEKFESLLAYTYEQGVRLFDCADLYGTHPYVGRVMKSKPRDSYQLVSKIWVRPGGLPERERPDADVCIKRFLRELQTDYIDLVQIHCMTAPDWPRRMRRQMDIMARLKEQGLIRAHGVSCHSIEALAAAAEEPWVDVIHARVNPYGARTDGPMEKVLPILRAARQRGKGVIAMKLAGEGSFDRTKRRESVRFAMASGAVDVLIVGFEKPEHVDELIAHVREYLDEHTSSARSLPRTGRPVARGALV